MMLDRRISMIETEKARQRNGCLPAGRLEEMKNRVASVNMRANSMTWEKRKMLVSFWSILIWMYRVNSWPSYSSTIMSALSPRKSMSIFCHNLLCQFPAVQTSTGARLLNESFEYMEVCLLWVILTYIWMTAITYKLEGSWIFYSPIISGSKSLEPLILAVILSILRLPNQMTHFLVVFQSLTQWSQTILL